MTDIKNPQEDLFHEDDSAEREEPTAQAAAAPEEDVAEEQRTDEGNPAEVQGEGEGEESGASAPPRMAVVDESAWDDDEDDEDFGHLARLVEDEVVPEAKPKAKRPARKEAEPAPEQEPAADAEIPLHLIDADALWVVKRLRAKGFEAYLTGGCVRDLLLGIEPKDFDVATAAHPNEVKGVFRNCRLIGRRFRLAHVFFPGGKVIETATFRANPLDELEDLPEDLLVERDNVFGTVEDDARRRDLTINGLFYDPLAGKVIDFVEGRPDLEARLIRTIGDPQIRFREDPVRIMRAIKFAVRLDFDFEEATLRAMKDHVGELLRCAAPRLQEELVRLLTSKHGKRAWELCLDIGVAPTLLPELLEVLDSELQPLPVEAPAQAPRAMPEPPESEDGDDKPEAEGEPAKVIELHPEGAPEEPAEEARNGEGEQAPAPVAVMPPSPEERKARLLRLIASIDEVRERDAELSSAVVFSALLLPAWEALSASDQDAQRWVDQTCDVWTERMRMTRRDKETLWLLLKGLEQLSPARRRGAAARHLVGRPWFREALLLYTLSLHAEGQPLDEVAKWKAIARHYNHAYRQPKTGEKPPRSPREGGGRGERRGRRSGGRRGGGGGGGGGGGRRGRG